MLIWTLAFASLVATAALLVGVASWDGILLAARIGLVAALALALLSGARTVVRRIARPWEHAAWGHRHSARQAHPNRGPVREQVAARREDRRPAAVQARPPRAFVEGRVR